MKSDSTTVLVTGAGGFIGRTVVRMLAHNGYRVKAVVHRTNGQEPFAGLENVSVEMADILRVHELDRAMTGVDAVLHFAALVDSSRSSQELRRVNVEGTRNVWSCASAHGVKRAILCSSAAVYGLLQRHGEMIDESSPAKAIEPYGRSKLMAEEEALNLGASARIHTSVIRPVATFGPGEHTPFGKKLRDAMVSKVLFAGGFQNKRFTFVHVDDVAAASIHLLNADTPSGEVFNVAASDPILYQDAFEAYVRVLRRLGDAYARIKMLALFSRSLHKAPWAIHGMYRLLGERIAFRVWHPGFDLLYSSAKLRATSFTPMWNDFEEILFSCAQES
jgi:UDP-glucose 4-epimerase